MEYKGLQRQRERSSSRGSKGAEQQRVERSGAAAEDRKARGSGAAEGREERSSSIGSIREGRTAGTDLGLSIGAEEGSWRGSCGRWGRDLGLSIGAEEGGRRGSCGRRGRTPELRTAEGRSLAEGRSDGGRRRSQRQVFLGVVWYFSSFSPGRRNAPATSIVVQRE